MKRQKERQTQRVMGRQNKEKVMKRQREEKQIKYNVSKIVLFCTIQNYDCFVR
jgi:hypothetical protein